MSRVGLLVAGGGPAGHSAARGYREAGGEGEVVLVGAEPHRPYRRPPLTKEYLRGEAGPEALPLEDEDWYAGQGVTLRLGERVTGLDPEAGTATTESGPEIAFERCVLATGARPAGPGGVRVMRTREHSDALRAAGNTVAVVGSGFIGCEAAASLALTGREVTLVSDEPMPQSRRLGGEVGVRIAAWLEDTGVRLRMASPMESLDLSGVTLEGGERIAADTVVSALGIEPAVEPAEAAGLELDEGRIACDEAGRTSAPGVFAAGDVARLHHPLADRRLSVEHWGDALAQGGVAGRAAAGDEQVAWTEVPGFWSTIGRQTLKQAAWGDGHDTVRLEEHGDAWTAWLLRDGRCVGVLTHQRDEDYERGRGLVADGARL